MSSTCAVASCHNDRRKRHRWLVMPHVSDLQFHKPKPAEYLKWEAKIQREGYTVNSNTRVCSNHFRHARPLPGCSAPTQYLRSYPGWAVTRKQAQETLATVDDGILREVTSHVLKFVSPDIIKTAANHLDVEPTREAVCGAVAKATFVTAKTLLNVTLPFVPGGRCLEALHLFVHGGTIQTSSASEIRVPPLPHPAVSMNFCSNFQYPLEDFHNYSKKCSISDPVSDLHDYSKKHTGSACYTSEENIVNDLSTDIQSKVKPSTKCKRRKCMARVSSLAKIYFRRIESLKGKLQQVRAENIRLKGKIETMKKNQGQLQKELSKPKVCIENIKGSDKLVHLHTGLPSYKYFDWLMKEVEPASKNMAYWRGSKSANVKKYQETNTSKPGPTRTLSMDNELLLTLMKLKLNMSEDYLSFLFGVSQGTVSTIVSTWIPHLSHELAGLIYWPENYEMKLCYPQCFKKWPAVRAILDCFEIPTERPSHVEANTQIFSAYKNRPTTKFLLACTPGGSVSFISAPAGGNMSDKEFVIKSGILDKFSPGDQCMVDKGFKIKGELLERGVELIIPPFVCNSQPFTDAENELNKLITTSRIHVERVIGHVHDYRYMSGVVPVTQLDLIGPATTVCCALTNLKNGIV